MRIDPSTPPRVGVTYHPFLQGAISAHGALFDLVEVPLELYADEARRGLLDPDLARLRVAAAGQSVLWRGTDLSVDRDTSGDLGGAGVLPARVVGAFGSAPVSVAVAPSDARCGEAAGHALGPRCDALRDRCPGGLVLDLPLGRLVEAGPTRARTGLTALAAATACPFGVVIGPDGPHPDAAAEILDALPPGRVAHVILAAQDATAWPVLEAALALTEARSVVVRRERHLFPIGDILDAAARCRDALGRAASRASPPAERRPTSPGADGPSPAPPTEHEAAVARTGRQVWREHVRDLHRARQLARWTSHRGAFG